MTLKETLAKLESLGDEKRRAFNIKNGAGKLKQFGVAMGDLRARDLIRNLALIACVVLTRS
jgi:hypothetical protein